MTPPGQSAPIIPVDSSELVACIGCGQASGSSHQRLRAPSEGEAPLCWDCFWGLGGVRP